MKNILLLCLILAAQVLNATEIKITPETPLITPTELIYTFPTVDWAVIEKRQDAGKDNRDSMVMLCDDTNYSTVEIKLDFDYDEEKSGLDGITIETDDCGFDGVNTNKFAPAWLHFSGPKKSTSCEVIIQKERSGGKTPLKMVFELHDAC